MVQKKDPMGSDRRWFVDNGLTQGFLPCHVLTAFGDSSPERCRRTISRPEVKASLPPPQEVTETSEADAVEMPAEAGPSQDPPQPCCEDQTSNPVSFFYFFTSLSRNKT